MRKYSIVRVIFPPNKISIKDDELSVFLAGSIELGLAEMWQDTVIEELKSCNNLVILNPRRKDWDNSWTISIKDEKFKEQVCWELDCLEIADKIIMYFDPQTKSPISLLEFGLFARTGKLIVVCPEGFWRKGNVNIVCEKYNIQNVTNLKVAIETIKKFKKK